MHADSQEISLNEGAFGGLTQHHATETFNDAIVEAQMLVDNYGIAQKRSER